MPQTFSARVKARSLPERQEDMPNTNNLDRLLVLARDPTPDPVGQVFCMCLFFQKSCKVFRDASRWENENTSSDMTPLNRLILSVRDAIMSGGKQSRAR